MKIKLFLLLTILFFNLSSCFSFIKPAEDRVTAYIEKYGYYAVQTMKKYQVPASITIAQGILESGFGEGELAMKSNNHFGIKCHAQWKGETTTHDDDADAECFRVYNSVLDSYFDHGEFLTARKWYESLFELPIYDYEAWAKGLSKCGYATDPEYSKKIIDLIEKYKLYQLDEM
ncbi:hypothetical protein EI427_12570 [Flammeovirga pectinis]|uniref:Mannosyl-glycoprotein endo-beta-N-acetylglucosamidase-like domain-containing protein n=1 Tax=Flammeovirga pectinis TaxID=2494373 RepID=A0A3S9P4B3_9BACT|nr:glucosaminidase domain-containing protein [Flammeovirga pectinis]AZQ63039.1 hypothetical protein EI427_12570 [Flammeovirga pectinis]